MIVVLILFTLKNDFIPTRNWSCIIPHHLVPHLCSLSKLFLYLSSYRNFLFFLLLTLLSQNSQFIFNRLCKIITSWANTIRDIMILLLKPGKLIWIIRLLFFLKIPIFNHIVCAILLLTYLIRYVILFEAHGMLSVVPRSWVEITGLSNFSLGALIESWSVYFDKFAFLGFGLTRTESSWEFILTWTY